MRILQSLIILFCLASCQHNTKQQQVQTILHWQQKEIFVPQSISINWNGLDSCDLFYKFDYKIVYYIDGDCHTCLNQISRIDSVYQTIKTQYSTLLIYVYSADYKHLEKSLNQNGKTLQTPLLYDRENSFYKQNQLPSDPLFHSFLIDKDNHVIVAGSFIANQQMTDLYSKILQSK